MKINTRIITGLAMLGAMSIVILLIPFLRFELFPPLEYDFGDIPIIIAGFIYGPVYGLLLTIIVSAIQGLTPMSNTGIYGVLMNVISTGTFVVVASSIYKNKKTLKNAVIGLIIGVVATTIIMIGANLIITPYYLGIPRNSVKAILLPTIIPFNLSKYALISILCFILYKRIHKTISFLTGDRPPLVNKANDNNLSIEKDDLNNQDKTSENTDSSISDEVQSDNSLES